jgi:hypothetical protein
LRLGYVKLELEEDELEKVEVEISPDKMKRRQKAHKLYNEVPMKFSILVGGIEYSLSNYSNDPPKNLPLWNWEMAEPIKVQLYSQDSINLRAISSDDISGGIKFFEASFYLTETQLLSKKSRLIIPFKRRSGSMKQSYQLFLIPNSR